MIIGILQEPVGETRVSLLPDAVKTVLALGNEVLVEQGAGAAAFASDDAYRNAGAVVAARSDVLARSGCVLAIHPIPLADIERLAPSCMLIGMYQPLVDRSFASLLAARGLVAFSLDAMPRITRAQSMDVLSSMSTVAGYKAVLVAAAHLPRFFPMLMTAAGTVPPARVLVIGAGVAGLQAIATARRLGAVVEAFDTRPSVQEQVESLGAKFVVVEGAVENSAAGGYAVEQDEDYKRRQADAVFQHVQKADVVITTALIPGKPAPRLVTTAMLNAMRPGSVVVDLAAAAGGNCEATRNGETVVYNGVTIVPASALPASMPEDASRMYGKNLTTFLKLVVKHGEAAPDYADEVVRGTCIAGPGV